MNSRTLPAQIIYFLVYVLVQVAIFENIVLFNKAFCFLYIAFLLVLPLELGRITLMLIGFVTGISVDIFYDSLGIHTAASVLIMYLRPHWLNLITPRGGYENLSIPTLKSVGLDWFSTYAFPLVLIHSFALFYIEAGGFHMFFYTFLKVLFSSVLTFTIIIITQYLFYSGRRVI